MKIKSDERLNSELKKEIQDLRGSMAGQIFKKVEPEKYTVTPCKDAPAMIIDYKGKTAIVSICDMHGAIQVLNELL